MISLIKPLLKRGINMKLKDVYEVNLYSVFAAEKAKRGQDYTISYNNKKQQLKYTKEGEGTLTVRFMRDRHNTSREDFYYMPEGKPDEEKMVFGVAANGNESYIPDEGWKIPTHFLKIADSYRDKKERARMGIEKAQAAAKKHKKLTFGKDM